MSAGGTRRDIGFFRRVHPTRQVTSRAFASPVRSGSATGDETNCPCPYACDHHSAERYLQRTTMRHGDRPRDRRDRSHSPSPSAKSSDKDRPSDPPLLGLCSLQRFSSGGACCPELPASGRSRFDVFGRPGLSYPRVTFSAAESPFLSGHVRSSLRFFAWRFGPRYRRPRVWSHHAIERIGGLPKRRIAEPLRHSSGQCV